MTDQKNNGPSMVPIRNQPSNDPMQGAPQEQSRSSAIHTDRYSSWTGTLDGRQAIVKRTIMRGFKHILSNKWIKVLVVLMWFFIVVLPLILAFFGFNNLIQSADDSSSRGDEEAYDLIQSYNVGFPISESISQGDLAVYNITVMNAGEITDVVTVHITYFDHDWTLGLFPAGSFKNGTPEEWNQELDQMAQFDFSFTLAAHELMTFHLVVAPPDWMVSGMGIVGLRAESQGAISASAGIYDDEYYYEVSSQITTITRVGQTEGSPYHFIMTSDLQTMNTREVDAGDEIEFPVTITNTGSVDETFIIRVDNLPNKDWSYRFEGLNDLSGNLSGIGDNEVGVYLLPGENHTFTVFYDTPKYPSSSNFIGVSAYSVNDPSLSGGVVTIVEAKNIPDQDMTKEIISGLFTELFMLFALFLAAVAGSRAISEDISQKSFTIYFSRPIKKLDYIALKFGSVGAAMCFGTMVPVLVTYAGLIALSDVDLDYVIDHLWVWGAIILYSLIIVAVLTSITLACSSLTSRRFYAAFGLVVIYIISTILSAITQNDFNDDRGSAISIYHSIQMVGSKIFDLSDVTYEYDWTYNLMALLTIIAVSTSIVIMKVWRTELSE